MQRWRPFLCSLALSLGWMGHAQAAHVALEAPYGWASCYVMGDSIAVGTAQQLPQCWSDTKVGLNTQQARQRFINNPITSLTVISLGVNDRGTRLPTVDNLAFIRSRVRSPIVIWILPTDLTKREDILRVAGAYNDRTIDLNDPDLRRYVSQVDHIHPSGTGYAELATRAQAMAWHP